MKRIAAVSLLCLIAVVTVVHTQSPDDIALAKLAVTAHSTGNLLLEQILLRRLTIESSGDLADGARHRLAENALERGDYGETIRLLSGDDPSTYTFNAQQRRDRAMIGETRRLSGDSTGAIQALQNVLNYDPKPDAPDDADLMAVKSLDAIGGDVDENEHFRRAGVYQFNRYWDEARQHYRYVKTTSDAAEALFQTARGYSQSSEYDKAIPYFQGAIDHFPDTQQAKDALLQLAAAYSRVNSTDQAISLYQSFVAKYPAGDKLDRAYLNIVDIYRDLGDDAHALEWCQRAEAAFPGKPPEALAIFDEAKIYASRSEWQNEIAALDRLKGRNDLGGASRPGGTTPGEVAFMRACALEMSGRREDAKTEYHDLFGAGDGFYETWASDRWEKLNAEGLSYSSQPKKNAPTVTPVAFLEIASRRSTALTVDGRLLLSIMYAESMWNPQARSNAAARGLMQFTHPQAVKIAKELGWTYLSDDELYSPENSIAFAAQYLADLQAMFPGQTEAVVASYNGGEDNVKRWMARAKSGDPERYVPELVFGQTKDYVAKVMANYRVYQQLYDEQLRPK